MSRAHLSGRPFKVLNAEIVSRLWSEYQDRPFNVSQRAREMGVKPCTLAYHIRGGKIDQVMRNTSWRAAINLSHMAMRRGDKKAAAQWLREAADRVDRMK